MGYTGYEARLNQPTINRRFAELKSRWIISVHDHLNASWKWKMLEHLVLPSNCRLLNMPERLPTAYNIVGLWVFLTPGFPWNDKYISEWKRSTRRMWHVTKGRDQYEVTGSGSSRNCLESGVWTPLFNRPGCHLVC
jgi:hypothetical protein